MDTHKILTVECAAQSLQEFEPSWKQIGGPLVLGADGNEGHSILLGQTEEAFGIA